MPTPRVALISQASKQGLNIQTQKTRLSKALPGFGLGLLLLTICGCQFPISKSARTAPPPIIAQNEPACIVLALPESGPYAPIAAKIVRGVKLAQSQPGALKNPVRLERLNTENPDWLTKLSSLPASCAVVGGPLQDKNYLEARKSGLLEQRVFFSFLPTLQANDEGRLAWRFFPSPKDQIEALIAFVTDGLNIRTYGSFYPADSYGPRMTALLEESLAARHIPLSKASYNPKDSPAWSAAVEPLIRPILPEGSKNPIPQTAFEAIFLPDSWKNMEMLTQSMLYNGEDRLVLLGTTLWEHGVSGRTIPKAESFALAIFPGAWHSENAPGPLKTPDADFWVALGYDFFNFASFLELRERTSPAEVLMQAKKAADKIQALAPLEWNDQGQARQKLHLFQIGPNGSSPLNTEQFVTARAAVLERSALRFQGLPPPETGGMATGPGQMPNVPQAGAVLAPEKGTGLSSSPRPSYKLHLPVRPTPEK